MSAPRVDMRNFGWRYGVQEGTGYPTSTVANGQWYRGQLVRASAPAFRLPPAHEMLDRSAGAPNRRGRLTRKARR